MLSKFNIDCLVTQKCGKKSENYGFNIYYMEYQKGVSRGWVDRGWLVREGVRHTTMQCYFYYYIRSIHVDKSTARSAIFLFIFLKHNRNQHSDIFHPSGLASTYPRPKAIGWLLIIFHGTRERGPTATDGRPNHALLQLT